MRTCLCAMVLAVTMAMPANAGQTPEEQLEGIETECARDVVDATWDVMRDQSWGELADLLSFGGAADMVALLSNTVRTELRDCFADVYRLGFEEGRRTRSTQEDPEPDYPMEP